MDRKNSFSMKDQNSRRDNGELIYKCECGRVKINGRWKNGLQEKEEGKEVKIIKCPVCRLGSSWKISTE